MWRQTTMYRFVFTCSVCRTEAEGFDKIGRDDDCNLVVFFWCDTCECNVRGVGNIEDLFDIELGERPDYRVVTEEDKSFLKGMKIAY